MVNSGENAVSAGTGSDFRVAIVGALMPFGLGLLVLLGYAWLSFFGAILGLLGALWWALWWRKKHNKKFFPRDVEGGPFVLTLVLAVLLFIVTIAAT
ncbi:hypothetical protein ALI144C_25395 [Actinosynnema sp. ALI-1.44]|uniref:hypothetical protein n=1 Tax=Actinosynnema sp. ALI-1.44 TaxID=1933779 RepID=UPI00097C31F8|nr:hypothetical protein [Actinosynnema sp. ALI-1.44]ONI79177.1 hypothetical protein ALI144C_25395 [Actinosynnema sp. ALI-1.44]